MEARTVTCLSDAALDCIRAVERTDGLRTACQALQPRLGQNGSKAYRTVLALYRAASEDVGASFRGLPEDERAALDAWQGRRARAAMERYRRAG